MQISTEIPSVRCPKTCFSCCFICFFSISFSFHFSFPFHLYACHVSFMLWLWFTFIEAFLTSAMFNFLRLFFDLVGFSNLYFLSEISHVLRGCIFVSCFLSFFALKSSTFLLCCIIALSVASHRETLNTV